jgi:hypothetical protein
VQEEQVIVAKPELHHVRLPLNPENKATTLPRILEVVSKRHRAILLSFRTGPVVTENVGDPLKQVLKACYARVVDRAEVCPFVNILRTIEKEVTRLGTKHIEAVIQIRVRSLFSLPCKHLTQLPSLLTAEKIKYISSSPLLAEICSEPPIPCKLLLCQRLPIGMHVSHGRYGEGVVRHFR